LPPAFIAATCYIITQAATIVKRKNEIFRLF